MCEDTIIAAHVGAEPETSDAVYIYGPLSVTVIAPIYEREAAGGLRVISDNYETDDGADTAIYKAADLLAANLSPAVRAAVAIVMGAFSVGGHVHNNDDENAKAAVKAAEAVKEWFNCGGAEGVTLDSPPPDINTPSGPATGPGDPPAYL